MKDSHATHDSAGNEYGKLKKTDYVDAPGATIPEGEYHPAADSAIDWLKTFMVTAPLEYLKIKASLQLASETGNKTAEYCMGTINRMAASEPVSDRYLLGLVWTIRTILDNEKVEEE